MAKGEKTGGRKPGSLNKATRAGADFVDRVEALLQSENKLSLEAVSKALLTCGNPAVIQKELQTLREYRYGKPKDNQEDNGTPQILVVPGWKQERSDTLTE